MREAERIIWASLASALVSVVLFLALHRPSCVCDFEAPLFGGSQSGPPYQVR